MFLSPKQHETLHNLIMEQSAHYDRTMPISTLFGMLMANYSNDREFILKAAAIALKEWDCHNDAAILRHLLNYGSQSYPQ